MGDRKDKIANMDISNLAVSAPTAVVSSASTVYGISTTPEFLFWIDMAYFWGEQFD